MIIKRSIGFLSSLCLFLVFGCGRKQRSLFDFDNQTNVAKVHHLALACPYSIKTTHTSAESIFIEWDDCSQELNQTKDEQSITFAGYFIYAVSPRNTISKKALNDFAIKNNQLTLTTHNMPEKITLRAAYVINNNVYFSPYSKIVSLKK